MHTIQFKKKGRFFFSAFELDWFFNRRSLFYCIHMISAVAYLNRNFFFCQSCNFFFFSDFDPSIFFSSVFLVLFSVALIPFAFVKYDSWFRFIFFFLVKKKTHRIAICKLSPVCIPFYLHRIRSNLIWKSIQQTFTYQQTSADFCSILKLVRKKKNRSSYYQKLREEKKKNEQVIELVWWTQNANETYYLNFENAYYNFSFRLRAPEQCSTDRFGRRRAMQMWNVQVYVVNGAKT